MDFHQRIAVRYLIKMRLSGLHGNEFQQFFAELMAKRHPDFVDVRTAGSLGDMSSDGLLLFGRKLFACYGPAVFNARNVAEKFEGDLSGAIEKRNGQFDSFVFVHNDLRGVHPTLSKLLADAAMSHPNIGFELFGYLQFRNEAVNLDQSQVEDLLGHPLSVQHVYSVELDEVVPLLEHLSRVRSEQAIGEIVKPSAEKLAYNQFTEETAEELRRAFIQAPQIDRYYAMRGDVVERDEAARAFSDEYLRIREDHSDAETILHQLEQYVLGNMSAPPAKRRAATVVIGYFFQSCDIFENAPAESSGTNGTE